MISRECTARERIARELEKEFPPLMTRALGSRATGYAVGERTLANLDSQGKGPGERLKIGSRVCYSRASFIAWILERLEVECE